MNDMEKAILDIIEKRYKCKYTGSIKVTKIGRGWAGYKVTFNFDNSDIPDLEIMADLEAKDFLKYVEQELISRQLHKVQRFKGIKYYPDDTRRTCQQN